MLRAAIFRELKRLPQHATASSRLGAHVPTIQLSVAGLLDPNTTASRRFFATNGKGYHRGNGGFVVNGIPLKTLAATPTPALIEEFGSAKVAKAIKVLPYHLDRLYEQSTTAGRASVPMLKQIFHAADKCSASGVMKKTLIALEKMQPRSRFEFALYKALYHALQRRHDHEGLLSVYDDFQTRLEYLQAPLPEVIYRFGIVGKFGSGDVAAVEEIVREMRQYNVSMTNDVWSHLMLGFAKAGNDERALKIFQFMMKGDITKLHEAEMNRVILALGAVGKSELAFEFYSECQIPLSASVFDALLSVCVQNSAVKEGIAILQNRKRFGLVLDAAGYAGVVEALEKFDLRKEIVAVLEEMKTQKVRFGPMIDEVIARNQDHLAGTVFTLREAPPTEEIQEIVATLRNALASDDLDNATRLADSLVCIASTQRKDEEAKGLLSRGATMVQPVEATDLVIDTYVRADHHHKITGLVRGLQLSTSTESEESQSSVALGLEQLFRVAVDAGDLERAHTVLTTTLRHASQSAATASVLQSVMEQATEVLVQTRDGSSALKLVDVLLNAYRREKETQPTELIHDVLHRVLGLLVREDQLKYAFAVLGNTQNHGVALTEQLYTSIATSMVKKNQVILSDADAAPIYSASDVESLWEDCRQRGVPISEALVASSSSLLARGGETQRALLWSAYQKTASDTNNEISFRAPVFQDVLEVAVQDHGSVEALAVYDTAVATLAAANSNVPADLLKSLVDKLVSENQVDEAFERLESATVKPPNSAIAVTLRAIVEADSTDSRAVYLLRRMCQLHKRGLGLPMATSLLEIASQQRAGAIPAVLASAVIECFEFRRVASDVMDLKSWKNVFNNLRGLESGLALYAVAHEACKGVVEFAGPLERRIEELEEVKRKWLASVSSHEGAQ